MSLPIVHFKFKRAFESLWLYVTWKSKNQYIQHSYFRAYISIPSNNHACLCVHSLQRQCTAFLRMCIKKLERFFGGFGVQFSYCSGKNETEEKKGMNNFSWKNRGWMKYRILAYLGIVFVKVFSDLFVPIVDCSEW